MDKETLSNYGWVVIAVLVISVMVALATPFGTFVSNGVKSTTIGLTQAISNSLGIEMPNEERIMPTNSIHVTPNEKFLIRKCSPAHRPRHTVSVSNTIDCVTEGVKNNSRMYSMFGV